MEVRAAVVEPAEEIVLEQGRGVLPARHPVGGVELQPGLVGVVEGDLEAVYSLLAQDAPALVPEPVAAASVVGAVHGVDGAPHFAVVVIEVAVGELPVDAAEVGVLVRLQLAHHLLGRGGPEAHERAECVVVGKQPLVRAVPAVGQQRVDLGVGERNELDVGDASGGALDGAGRVSGSHAPGHLVEDYLQSGEVGCLPVELLEVHPLEVAVGDDGQVSEGPIAGELDANGDMVVAAGADRPMDLVAGRDVKADGDGVPALDVEGVGHVGGLRLGARRDERAAEGLRLVGHRPPAATGRSDGQRLGREAPVQVGHVDGLGREALVGYLV